MIGTDTAKQIAGKALRILEKEGSQAVTMRRIARSVGITPMAIYHYFPTREALLKTVTDREFEQLAAYMDARLHGGSPISRVFKVIDAFLDYAFARPRIFDYVFSQPRSDARKFLGDFRDRRSPTMNRLAAVVSEAMRKGELKKDDEWEVSLSLWAHVHGHLALFRGGRFALSEKQFRRLCHRSLRRFLDGLKP